jgi:hypothetical protein
VFKGSVLIFESDEFLLVAFEDIDLILKMTDNDILLVGLDLDRGVEVRRTLGG